MPTTTVGRYAPPAKENLPAPLGQLEQRPPDVDPPEP